MSAALLTQAAPAASQRLLEDVSALADESPETKLPALDRLEAMIGREFADKLVAALSDRGGTRP